MVDIKIEKARSVKIAKELDEYKGKVNKLNVKNETLEKEVERLEEENSKLRVQLIELKHSKGPQESSDKNNNETTEVQKLRKKLKEANQQNEILLQKIHHIAQGKPKISQQKEQPTSNKRKLKAMLIADSNRKEIVQHLNREKIE